MDQKQLLDAAIAHADKSLRGFAAMIGMDHSELVKWRTGERTMTLEEAIALAMMAEMPNPAKTAASIRATTAKHKFVREALKKLSAAAALILWAMLPNSAQSHSIANVYNAELFTYSGQSIHMPSFAWGSHGANCPPLACELEDDGMRSKPATLAIE